MPHRFYMPDLPDSGNVTLEGAEAHHLIHVLRSKPGDMIEVFDGAGLSATAKIVAARKRDADVQVLSIRRDSLPRRKVIVATAVPKGDRFDWMIEKLTELGVSKVIPLVTERSAVDPRETKLDRLRQTIVSACKQSGRNDLLELAPVTGWSDFCLKELPGRSSLIAHPGPDSTGLLRCGIDRCEADLVFAIGPEGGFTDVELALATGQGAKPVSLGRHILRIETAALALASFATLGVGVPETSVE